MTPNRRGFTLLEMLVATTIMAIAVVGLLNGISGATRNAARLRDYDRVVQLARLKMNDLLVDERTSRGAALSGTFDRELTGGTEAGWSARVTQAAAPPMMMSGQYSIDRIELEIWWMAGPARRTFSLDAFRHHVLTGDDLLAGGVSQ